jgi:hypothetical protein
VCCRYLIGVELACDLTETSPGGMLGPDPVGGAGRDRGWASGARLGMLMRSSGPPSFPYHALQLVDGDQPCAPGRLERLDQGQDASVEGGAADAECLGCLCSGVGESLNTCCLAYDRCRRSRPEWLRLSRVSLRFLVSSPHSTA